MKPLIGITAGEVRNYYFPWLPATQGQRYTYVDAIVHAGGIPVILPIVAEGTVARQLYELCDGLLLAGGNDVDPVFYGAEPKEPTDATEVTSPRRDKHELQLLNWALADDKPILGICRGLQLLNVHLGGTLYRDILSETPNGTNHDISASIEEVEKHVHRLRIKPDSKLAKILEATSVGTNSQHHQAVKKLAENLQATAWSEDGVIEALEMPDKEFVLAVQSHPESLENIADKQWSKLFRAFVVASQ